MVSFVSNFKLYPYTLLSIPGLGDSESSFSLEISPRPSSRLSTLCRVEVPLYGNLREQCCTNGLQHTVRWWHDGCIIKWKGGTHPAIAFLTFLAKSLEKNKPFVLHLLSHFGVINDQLFAIFRCLCSFSFRTSSPSWQVNPHGILGSWDQPRPRRQGKIYPSSNEQGILQVSKKKKINFHAVFVFIKRDSF